MSIGHSDPLTLGPPDYPLEYIEGRVNFFGREFIVTPDVLIPRLETESLVRRARQILCTIHSEQCTVNNVQSVTTQKMIGIAPLPIGEDSPVSVANQGGIVSGKAQSLMGNREPWYAHSDRAIPYNPELLRYARENRKAGNPVENRFWYDILRSGPLKQYKFTRQKPLLSYIVDFYSSELGIIIELDGESHTNSMKYDQERTDELEKYGLKIVRYSNQDIMMRTEGVVYELVRILEARKKEHCTPLPPLEGGLSSVRKGQEFSTLPLHTFSILESTDRQTDKPTTIIDIGCGSGIIGTSVADLADEVIFLDISPATLVIAERNFRAHFPEKKARFIASDLLGDCPHSYLIPHTSYLFLANLPYIRQDDWEHMSADTVHEPRLALFGGEQTGFELYERLFDQLSALAPLIREEGGFSTWKCLFEFGFDQRDIAEEILKKYPQWEYSFFADYAGVERFGELSVLSLKR